MKRTAFLSILAAALSLGSVDAFSAMPPANSPVVDKILSDMVPIPGKDYRMGKFEVTQAQWEAVMGENPSDFKGADNPVECVSWDDCQEFLQKLNALPAVKESGLIFRLPTEEEWEHACRAGATGDYCKLADGTEITEETLDRVAWFKHNSDMKTHPVGGKEPNAFGLYDMHGNVREWTQTAVGGYRVFRGGCWYFSAWYCGSSYRLRYSPDIRINILGFRLCASGRADSEKPAKKAGSESARQAARERGGEGGRAAGSSIESLLTDMVQIPGKDYRMGKFEVTQAQWEAVMGSPCPIPTNWSELVGSDMPAVYVSWDDCQEFLKKLNALPAVKESGLVFRLPTEEEWEYACRADATGDYCKLADGTEITEDALGRVAWFDDNSNDKTHPVGGKEPNAFGLYDMHGNVWEWTQTADGGNRVNRGGCWSFSARDCGSSDRNWLSPDSRYDYLGLRLCASGRAD